MALDIAKFNAAMEQLQKDFPEVDLHYTIKVVAETKEEPVKPALKEAKAVSKKIDKARKK